MEPRPGTSADELAVVIDLRDHDRRDLPPPSAESLAEVRAEALIRAAARRAATAQDSAPSVTRRGFVVSLVCGLLLLVVALWPSVSGLLADDAADTPAAPTTVRQAGSDGPGASDRGSAGRGPTSSGWDPWVDPFAGTLP